MTRSIYLYDDAIARQFAPFSLTRPASELQVGALLTRQRWARVTGQTVRGFLSGQHLANFDEFDAPNAVSSDDVIPAGSVVINARCIVQLDAQFDADATAWKCGDQICAVRVQEDVTASQFADGTVSLDSLASQNGAESILPGRWLTDVWDTIGQLTTQLTEDIVASEAQIRPSVQTYKTIGDYAVIIEDGAIIEPYVVFDASAGPIMIRRGTTISAFTRISGPCYIGSDCTIIGDRIAASSIGDHCKIRGEISCSVVLGYSNKGHTGFVGHSYLGRWVNLGAGTTTSNLKNTYGTVQLWTPNGVRDTKLQFLGTLFGDHAKTGIGTMLNTGTVLGTGANVYGAKMPPKHVPPFAWGDEEPYATFALEKFLAVAERVMGRRRVTMSERQRAQLAGIHPQNQITK